MLYFRNLRGLPISLWHLWHKFSILISNQVKREQILINVWRFSVRYSSDKDCVFAGLKKLFTSSEIFKYVVEWNPAIRYNAEITFSPKYHWHYCSCWWIITCIFYFYGVLFRLNFIFQINNFFDWALFSAVINKRRGKKLIGQTIEYKLVSSSKMQWTFFYPKDIQHFFWKTIKFVKNLEMTQIARGGGRVEEREGFKFFASFWRRAHVIHPLIEISKAFY